MRRITVIKAWADYYKHRLRRQVTAWLTRARTPEERNALHLYGDIAWFGIVNGILGTFTGVFAIRLGASETLVGLLSSLPALINVFWQVPSARIVERQKQVRTLTVYSLFLQRIVYLLIAIMPFFLLRYRAEAFVALITVATLPGALGGVAFTSLLAEAVPVDQRANVVSIRNMLLSLTGMLSVLLAGKLLDAISFPYNYQLLFVIAFAASLISLYHVRQVQPLHERPLPSAATKPREPVRVRLKQAWQSLTAEKNFLNYAAGSFIYNWGLYFPMALYNIYRVRDLGASDTWLGLLSMVASAVQTVMYLFWGRVIKRRGNRWVFLISAFGLAGFPLFTGLATRVEPLLLVAVWGGIFTASYSVSSFGCLLDVSPPDRLATYTATYNTLVNVTAFIAPLLGTTVASWISARYALILGGVIRIIGAIALSRLPFGPSLSDAAGSATAPPPLRAKILRVLRRGHPGKTQPTERV